jgi:hypothetical protein
MTGFQFDRITRVFSRMTSRRSLVGGLSALWIVSGRPARAATQLEVAACSAEGEVCTHLMGCCDGFFCATSHINTTYGVCIPGEGEHVAVTTQLVVPEGDGVVELLAAELVEAEADGAAAAEVMTARETKEDDRRSRRRTRKDDKRAKRRTRADTKRTRKRERKQAAALS